MALRNRVLLTMLGIVAAMFTSTAFAIPMNYSFSYNFTESGQNLQVTGSFTGDDHGTYADNITNILMSYSQGGGPFTAVIGPLYIANYFSAYSGFPPSANGQVYYNLGQNNFLIVNCDYGTSPCASTAGFLLRNGLGGGDEDTNFWVDSTTIGRESSSNTSWNLTSTPTVPEPASLLLLSIGLMGVVGAGRIKKTLGQSGVVGAVPVGA